MSNVLPLEISTELPQSPAMTQSLKLLAYRMADIDVISAVLQDAAMTIGDMTYLPTQRRFAIVANRFLWESQHESASGKRKKRTGRRRRVGLHFDDVQKAEIRLIPHERKDHVLALLAITATEHEDGAASIMLNFAGGGTIRLSVECINATLMDLSDTWPALRIPQHNLD